MPAFVVLADGESTLLHTETVGVHTHLITEDHARVATQYKSATHTTNTTTALATPKKGNAVVVTDITISGEKITGGKITLQWADGTDTAVIEEILVADGIANLHIAYTGRNLGWKDARVDFITSVNNQDATVNVGYYFVRGVGVISFADWDALR